MPLVSFLDADKVHKFDAYSSPSSSLSSTGGGGGAKPGGGGASGRSPPGRNKDKLSEKEMKILRSVNYQSLLLLLLLLFKGLILR